MTAITWITATLRNPETKKPFELLPCEVAFLEHAFDVNEDGAAKYPEQDYVAPKKTGKTTFGGIVVLTATLLYGGGDAEAICVANDLEQSQSRIFAAIKKIVRASPRLRNRARITNREITFNNGATITAIASDAAGAAGSNAVISIGDELWGFTSEASRRLWDELVPPPTRKFAIRLVVSYAGFTGESQLLEERYKHGIAQPLIDDDLYAGEGHLCFWTHRVQAPWQTDAWLAQMRRSLRPNQYARMIECRWTTSESAFIEMHHWDSCVDDGLRPLVADRNLQVFVGVDASLKRDSTAVVAVTTDGERVRLVRHRVFQPSPDQPLDFEATIEAGVADLCTSFAVQEIRYDPWQMAAVAQRLTKRSAPMVEFPQTTSNLTDASSNLYELIKAGNLQVYPDEAMRLSVSQAIAVETPRGWRIAKDKTKHKIDVVVALGMACHAAIKQQPVPHAGLLEYYRLKATAINATASAPTLMQEHGHQPVMQIGTRPTRPSDWVRVIIPGDASQICGWHGSYTTELADDGTRFAWVDPRDAKVLVCSAAPSNLATREANPQLRERLAADKTISTEPLAMKAEDIAPGAAIDDRHSLRRIKDELASYFRARNASVHETLELIGRR